MGTEKLVETIELMHEETFWAIIDDSLQHSDDQIKQEALLIEHLKKMQPQEIVGFRLRIDKLLKESYFSELWCAAYIINGGCSDDGFEYFRCWLISRGKEVYYAALTNPDSLVTEVEKERDDYEFETFWYVALRAFSSKTGKELFDYVDDAAFNQQVGNYPLIEFNWEEYNLESMVKICPKLFAKCWKTY